MKSEKIVDALDYLPDEMLYETDRIRQKKPLKWWKPLKALLYIFLVVHMNVMLRMISGVASVK